MREDIFTLSLGTGYSSYPECLFCSDVEKSIQGEIMRACIVTLFSLLRIEIVVHAPMTRLSRLVAVFSHANNQKRRDVFSSNRRQHKSSNVPKSVHCSEINRCYLVMKTPSRNNRCEIKEFPPEYHQLTCQLQL